MPAVSVERVPVKVFSLGLLGFDHLQIVFRPEASSAHQDGWYVIEGVRDFEVGGRHLRVEGLHGATTLAEANGGRTGVTLSDWIGTGTTRGARIVAEGEEAARVWSTLVSYATDIDAQKFPYIAAALPASSMPIINSSSLVASLLHYAGIDIAAARPWGLRFSPGMATLLGTSMDDTMKAGRSFSTLVAGDGDDTLIGSEEQGQIDKMFGGRGNDTIHWSAGLNIIHGGQPGVAEADDGIDTVDYTGAGALLIEAAPNAVHHHGPDYIVRHAVGEDRLYSIEEIVWDGAHDSVELGEGVALAPRPLGTDKRMAIGVAAEPHKLDRAAEPHKLDRAAEPHKLDRAAEPHEPSGTTGQREAGAACLGARSCDPLAGFAIDDPDFDIAIACLFACGPVQDGPAAMPDVLHLDIVGGH